MPSTFPQPFVAAVVQWAPAYHDLERGTQRAIEAIAEAAAAGARLVVFPESWLPGYPYFSGEPTHQPEFRALYRELHENAVVVPGPEIDAIKEAAAAHGVVVVLGVTERDAAGSTFFCSLLTIDDQGVLRNRHRKLMPTISEKLIWGFGDGSDLDVVDTPLGRVGGLICYEHLMAPARYACCQLGIQLQASVWPGHAFLDGVVDAATRHLAMENGCFVLVARDVMSADRRPADSPLRDHPFMWNTHGGSAIIAPGGEYLAGPVFDEETILYAEIDLARVLDAKWWVDGTGHYSRPDVFRLVWNRSPKPAVAIETTPLSTGE